MRTALLEKSVPDFPTLLESSKEGDHDAFGQLWDLYLANPLSKAATLELPCSMQSRVRASDLVSDTARRVWEHLRDFRGRTPEELRSWARTILRCELRRAHEKDRPLEGDLRIDRPSPGDAGDERLDLEDSKARSPSSLVGDAEEAERLKREHSELEWRLLILWGEDRSWKDVADILDSEFGDRREPDAWRMYLKRLIIEQKTKRGISDGHRRRHPGRPPG
jgi:DNA-directed RNA polymerase specialized sigma24 family protein